MQYSTSHQKPPVSSHNETSKLSTDLSRPSPRSMYSSATQGKKIDESRNISIGTSESELTREKPKYPIKIPVEQMKMQKTPRIKSKEQQEIKQRPATAKSQKKSENSLSKDDHIKENFQTTESNKPRERMARPQSAKPQKSAARPKSSRGSKKGVENKRRQNMSIDQGKGDDQRISKLNEIYQQELHDLDESRKDFAERARRLMMENLMKYQEDVRKQEEIVKQKKQEKEQKKTKEVEKAKEVHERAQKNQMEQRSSRTRKSDRGVSESKITEPKQEIRAKSKKVEKKENEPEKGLAKKKEEMAIAYGMEDHHLAKTRKQKVKNEWDEESNEKERYNIKKKEKAPEEKEKLKQLVHEQFEKKKKEEMEQKAIIKQEKEKKKQRLDALMKTVDEIQHKDTTGKHAVTKKTARKPFHPIDENAQTQQTLAEEEQEPHEDEHYQTAEHQETEERDEDFENEEEENEEREEFERVEKEVDYEDHNEDHERGEKEEDYEDMSSEEKEAKTYALEPLTEIANSNNSSLKKGLPERKLGQYEYVEKSNADKKLQSEDENEMDKENVNMQNYRTKGTEEKQKETKKYPNMFKENIQEAEEVEQKDEEELDFDDMLFTMSSEQLMKLPYFSLAK